MALELLVPNPPRAPYPLLALDLSTVAVGWAVVMERPTTFLHASSGTERLTGDLDNRLAMLGAWVGCFGMLPAYYVGNPALVVVEVPDLSAATGRGLETTGETLHALYEAAGVVRECCRRAGVPMVEVDARRVRERLCGVPTATKQAVQWTLQARGYTLPQRNGRIDHDAADALALAVVVNDELTMLARAEG